MNEENGEGARARIEARDHRMIELQEEQAAEAGHRAPFCFRSDGTPIRRNVNDQ